MTTNSDAISQHAGLNWIPCRLNDYIPGDVIRDTGEHSFNFMSTLIPAEPGSCIVVPDVVLPHAKPMRNNSPFAEALKNDPDISRYLTDAEIDECFTEDYFLKHVNAVFDRVFSNAHPDIQAYTDKCREHRIA